MSNFLLGPLGSMVEVEGVQAGTGVTPNRQVSQFQALSGAVLTQQSRFAPRSWSLDLGQWRDPLVVRHLMAAARRRDLWLFDKAAARANILHAHQSEGDGSFPDLMVDGWPISALNLPSAPVTTVQEFRPDYDTWARVSSYAPYTNFRWDEFLSKSLVTSLWRINLPAAPANLITVSFELTVDDAETISPGTVQVMRTGGSWNPSTVTWVTRPPELGSVGSFSAATGTYTSTLSLSAADLGTSVNLMLTSSTGQVNLARTGTVRLQVTTVSYPAAISHSARVPVRAGQHTLIGYTNAANGPLMTWSTGAQSGSVNAPVGAGVKRFATTFTLTTDGIITLATDVAVSGLVSGLRLIEGPDDGDPYIPGHGAFARVSSSDLTRALQYTPDGARSKADYAVTFTEVGTPGVV